MLLAWGKLYAFYGHTRNKFFFKWKDLLVLESRISRGKVSAVPTSILGLKFLKLNVYVYVRATYVRIRILLSLSFSPATSFRSFEHDLRYQIDGYSI